MNHQEMIDVIQAHADGKTIEYVINRRPDNEWRTCLNNAPAWDFHQYDYRIKHEPREFYLYYDEEGLLRVADPTAITMSNNFIHVREVLDDEA